MFSDETVGAVEWKSSWSYTRPSQEASCQASTLKVTHSGMQTRKKRNMDTQTDEDKPVTISEKQSEGSKHLDRFIRRVGPVMLDELEKGGISRAFDEFKGERADRNDNEIVEQCRLSCSSIDEKLEVTNVSWNCNGTLVAATLATHSAEQSMEDVRSYLCCWRVHKKAEQQNKPDIMVEVETNLTCLTYHPEQPSVIAAGTFTGIVNIWNFTQEDAVKVSSVTEECHVDWVTQITWRRNEKSKRRSWLPVSVGQDGKIIFWGFISEKKELRVQEGYQITTNSLPRSIRGKARQSYEVGLTNIMFSQDDTLFFVGTNAGVVIQCRRETSADKMEAFKDPTISVYSPHAGPITDIRWSPFCRRGFLSTSTDGELRINDTLQPDCSLSLCPGRGYLFSAAWSSSRPLVLYAGCQDGYFVVYDLQEDRSSPLYSVQVSKRGAPIYSLEICKSEPSLLAVGTGDGEVAIWYLPSTLQISEEKETNKLVDLVESHS